MFRTDLSLSAHPMQPVLLIALIGAACAVFPLLLQRISPFRKTYTVHQHGLVIVTGASSGIGHHVAHYLAQHHPNVTVLAGVRKEEDAQNFEGAQIDNLHPVMIDMAREASIDAAVEQLETILDGEKLPLLGIVNNAGISSNAPLEYLPMKKLRELFETNVVGPTYLTQRLSPMLRKHQGRVVQVSSVLGQLTLATRGAYCASKHALEALSDVLRLELSSFGVSVSIIQPAYVATHIFGKIAQQTQEITPGSPIYEVYGNLFYREDQALARQKQITKADSPLVTSRAIEHALFSPEPRTRYAVASFDWLPAPVLLYIDSLLPDRVADWLKEKLFG